MSDLLVTSHTPVLGSGRALRTYGVVAALARSGPVEVAYVAFDAAAPSAAYAQLPGVTLRRLEASRGARRALAYARARLQGVPGDLARAISPELAAAADGHRGRVIADGPAVAAALLGLAGRREIVFLAHNLESGFRHSAALERFERRVLQTFSQSWMATRADAAGAQALAEREIDVRYVPNVVDVARIEPAQGPRGTHRVLLVADFTYEPNREGLAFLAGEVMPLVWERLPDARLAVAGRGLDKPPDDDRVQALGFVDDLEAVYAMADAVAVPMLTGGGSPLKFVEALAHGIPVVASDHAAGLLEDGKAGEDFLAAAGAPDFADALVRTLRGQAAGVGEHGRALAERSYSIEALAGLLVA
jgi:glycosyltransferase involved in cell wall biosynthesis